MSRIRREPALLHIPGCEEPVEIWDREYQFRSAGWGAASVSLHGTVYRTSAVSAPDNTEPAT